MKWLIKETVMNFFADPADTLAMLGSGHRLGTLSPAFEGSCVTVL